MSFFFFKFELSVFVFLILHVDRKDLTHLTQQIGGVALASGLVAAVEERFVSILIDLSIFNFFMTS